MSPTQTNISVEEYLSATYRPDCDYVDGLVLERNLGEKPHARLELFFGRFFAPMKTRSISKFCLNSVSKRSLLATEFRT
jgi:hypothetical protein